MEQPEEKKLYLATLVFPVRGVEVMLARKMKKIGKGCLNGWGGGVESDESPRTCAVREFSEETGGASIQEEDLVDAGVVHFKNHASDGTIFVCTVHVYTISRWNGEIVSTEEMEDPKWYQIDSIHREKLMLADPFWLPRMLKGDRGIAWAEYAPYQEVLIGEVRFERHNAKEE